MKVTSIESRSQVNFDKLEWLVSKGTPSTSNQIGESIEKSSGRKLIFVIGCSDNWRKMATKIIKVFFDNIKRL